ncbi:MAG: LysR family transcriptional regulator [Sphingopyxis sp.]
MQWDDLRFFLALARARTLGAAAKHLGVDGTTVGRRIERLSGELNASLFEHTPAGSVLSDAGQKLLTHAEDVERSILNAADALTGERGLLAGTVRISLSEGFAAWVIAPQLPQFQARHPDIKLEIATTNGFLNPSKREADLAVMLARPARGPLLSRKLADYSFGLYASREYIAAHPALHHVRQLKHHRLIGYIADFIYADELRYLTEISDALVPSFSSSSINVQHAMTRAGCGIAVLPHFIGRQDAQLVPILPDDVAINRSFWLVVHKDLRRVARVSAVIDWLDKATQIIR